MKTPIVDFFGFSDIGPVRSNNEDVWVSLPEHLFFALADGMGGHLAGEVAAKEATDHLCHLAETLFEGEKTHSLPQMIYHLRSSIKKVNFRVFELGQTYPQFKGMGTTLCCIHFFSNVALYAHIGDSRIYHYRNQLYQLTQDHSLLNKMKWEGSCDSSNKTCKNVITKAIGTTAFVEPEISHVLIEEGDQILLCTDGLSDYVSSEEISPILQTSATIQKKVENLIDLAKEKGSRDNMTVILLEVKGFDPSQGISR